MNHDEPLVCRHCCSSGDNHDCQEWWDAVNEAGHAAANIELYGEQEDRISERNEADDVIPKDGL